MVEWAARLRLHHGSVPIERFGGRRAFTTIHQFFKVNISIDHKGVDTKEEWSKNNIAALVSYICWMLLENMIKVPCVAASSAASVSLGEISRYIALLNTSDISKHPCHVIPRLSKNHATMYRLLQAANHIMIAIFLHGFACSSRVYCTPSCQMTFPYSNLEDKVLIGDGSIVMNLPQLNKNMNVIGPVIGPRRSNRIKIPSERLIWDPDPITN